MHSQLDQLLAKLVENEIAKVLHLGVHVALPLYPLFVRLAQNIKLDKVLIPGEKA